MVDICFKWHVWNIFHMLQQEIKMQVFFFLISIQFFSVHCSDIFAMPLFLSSEENRPSLYALSSTIWYFSRILNKQNFCYNWHSVLLGLCNNLQLLVLNVHKFSSPTSVLLQDVFHWNFLMAVFRCSKSIGQNKIKYNNKLAVVSNKYVTELNVRHSCGTAICLTVFVPVSSNVYKQTWSKFFLIFLWMSTGLLLSLYNALFLSQGPLTYVCLSSLQAA